MRPFHNAINELSQEECRKLLSSKTFGHLGCSDGNEVYVVPMSYVYDDGIIYCHSKDGKKIDFLRTKILSCLQVEDVRDFYNWKSVTAKCSYQELEGDEAMRCARLMINRLPHFNKIPPLEEDFASMMETSVMFRLKIITLNGRFEREAE